MVYWHRAQLKSKRLSFKSYFLFPVLRDDLIRAIKKLKVLGSGFGIIPVGGTYLIQSVPAELNMDHTVVLQLAEVLGARDSLVEASYKAIWFP